MRGKSTFFAVILLFNALALALLHKPSRSNAENAVVLVIRTNRLFDSMKSRLQAVKIKRVAAVTNGIATNAAIDCN